jgi:CRP-like cAMP-binding protein
MITSGEVEVTRADQAGYKAMLAKLVPGDFFGEMSLLTGEKRSATVTALEDTDVVVINKECLAGVLQANPDIAGSLSEILERRLKEIAEKMAELEKGRTTGKAAVETRGNLLKRICTFFHI